MRSIPRLVLAVALSSALPFAARPAMTSPADSTARDERLPAAEGDAKTALETSPRHAEFVDIDQGEGRVPLRAWVVYPERRDKAGVVVVIHEIYGLTDWIRSVADQLAREGFIAVAPDLLSGMGPGGGGTDSLASRDDAVRLVRGLTAEETARRLDAVRAYATHLPAASGRVATMGFCWGGSHSFQYAAASPAPDAAVVFYGPAPDSATLLAVRAPVLGLYGGDDARVNATIEPAQTVLRGLGRRYEAEVYEGAGHGFLRAQALRDGANLAATRQAWPRVLAFLREHLEPRRR